MMITGHPYQQTDTFGGPGHQYHASSQPPTEFGGSHPNTLLHPFHAYSGSNGGHCNGLEDLVKLEGGVNDFYAISGTSSPGSPKGCAAGGAPAPAQPHHYAGDEDFDALGLNMPVGSVVEGDVSSQVSPNYNSYHMMHQQQQQQQHQQHWHQHQQQHWHQQNQYASSNGYAYDHYSGYPGYQHSSASGSFSQPSGGVGSSVPSSSSLVGMGGPSPVGSQNTPSPRALSEDGFQAGGCTVTNDEGGLSRNNNVLLKRQSSPPPAAGGLTPLGPIHHSNHLVHYSGSTPYPTGQPGINMSHQHHIHHQVQHQQHMHPQLQQQHQHQQQHLMHHQQHHLHQQQQHHHHPHLHHPPQQPQQRLHIPPVPSMAVATRKSKVSKRKKKRDPNEPSKPVSAYALFFRDSQASIKLANPNAAFGDVSKIVASLWDSLDPDSKAAYKKRTENAKKEYLKKLAAYRASLVSKGGGSLDASLGYGYYGFGDLLGSSSLHKFSITSGSSSGPPPPSGSSNVSSMNCVAQQAPSYLGHQGPSKPPGAPQQQTNHSSSGLFMGHQQPSGGTTIIASNATQSPRSCSIGPPHMTMVTHNSVEGHVKSQHCNFSGDGASPNSLNNRAPVAPLPKASTPITNAMSGSQSPLAPTTASGHSASAGSNNNNNCVAPHEEGTGSGSSVATPSISISKKCGRPGCPNPVQRTPEGWSSDYCSNGCVVGQCREVYTSWSSSMTTGTSSASAGPPSK